MLHKMWARISYCVGQNRLWPILVCCILLLMAHEITPIIGVREQFVYGGMAPYIQWI